MDIVLRGILRSDALERYIGEEAQKLERICDRIRSCQVAVETLQGEKRRGAQFAVRLIITLPGTEVVFNREHGGDVYMAVRDAFAAAGLQLKDHMRRLGDVERRSDDGTPNGEKRDTRG
ncbi:MAG: ribosome-associated translation inhibitor RaiA [Burkholderiales bacterium]|nr:ribosome-associated translation inhibitor RaiA [Burkholderiales bacterium]